MLQLTREVRFSCWPNSQSPEKNSWAGSTSLSLAPFAILQCTVSGELESDTDYICNIKLIDDLVRTQIVQPIADGKRLDSIFELLEFAKSTLARQLPQRLVFEKLKLKTTPFVTLGWNKNMSQVTSYTEQFEFSASHRLHNPTLSSEQNVELFGKCNHINGHGHNYVVEVTVGISETENFDHPEFVRGVNESVIERFDHKHLNQDVEEFQNLNPTVENIASVIFNLLEPRIPQNLSLIHI